MGVFVVRAFVTLRQMLASNKELAQKLDELERKLQTHDRAIVDIRPHPPDDPSASLRISSTRPDMALKCQQGRA
jgi:hypothetical protein